MEAMTVLDLSPLSKAEIDAANTRRNTDDDDGSWTPILPVPENEASEAWETNPPYRGRDDGRWAYRDREGNLLGFVVRFDMPNGKKDVFTITYCQRPNRTRQWRCKAFPKPRPLYHLDQLAQKPDSPVLVVEGEKCAEAAAKLFPDFVTVTSPNGSDSAELADWSCLKGRDVAVWPDHDESGSKYADAVAGLTRAAGAAEIRIVQIPDGFPSMWDLADPLPAGFANDDLRIMLDSAKPWIAKNPAGLTTTWGDPFPLPDELPDVPELDPEILPDALRPWLVDIAARMQVKLDFVGAPAMVALGAAVGRQLCIRPKRLDDWTVAPNLWGAIVGRPGLLKTPVLSEVMAPLYRLEDAARDRYERELRDYDAQEILAHEARKGASDQIRKSLKGGKRKEAHAQAVELVESAPAEPARRRYVTNDSSVEKLGELLRDTSRGVLVFRDELVGLLRNLDKQGQESARAFYLEAWSGLGRFTYDRIGRGTVDIASACVSVLGGIQPGPLGTYLADAISGGQGDDGLLQRFQLLAWPDPPIEWVNVDRAPDAAAKTAAFEVFARLDRINPEEIGAERDEGVAFLRFDGGGQALFDDWRASLEKRLRSGGEHPALEAHFSKFRKVVPALALLTHLGSGGTGPVSETALAAALAWAAYLEDHARRLYASRLGVEAAAARELFRHLKRGDLPDRFTARDVTQKHWSGLDTESVSEALEDLVARGWLRAESVETGGRPTTRYHQHASLRRAK